MKEYPSISKALEEDIGNQCIAFYKYDGSNIRSEWSRKTGWYKFGTRHRLFDKSDPDYGSAIELFQNTYGESIIKALEISPYQKAESIIAFCEFFGPRSFAGKHLPDDPKEMMLFDINIYKKGLLGPEEFIKYFGHLKIPQIIYTGLFDEVFIKDVREGKYPVFEGVVAKSGNGATHDLWLRKVKTFAYCDELQKRCGVDWKQYWEE